MPKSARSKKQPEALRQALPATGEITPSQPSDAEIAQRAYEIFLARGDAPGDEVSDWLQAEAELRGTV